jgi:hypothetical protein
MQLVGQTCERCQQRISSIAEGDFCNACGRPIHFHCLPRHDPIARGCCQQCGIIEIENDEIIDRRLEALHFSEAERQRQLNMRQSHGTDFGRKQSYQREVRITGAILLGCGLLGIVVTVVASGGAFVVVPIGALVSGIAMLLRGANE